MKVRFLLIIVTFWSASVLAQQSTESKFVKQDFGWAANNAGFFPIGWTRDGTYFAYGTFSYSMTIFNSSCIRVVVQDIVSDQVVWNFQNNWAESLAGDIVMYVPNSSEAAWKEIQATVEEPLYQYQIETGGYSKPAPFPLQSDGDELNIEITEQPEVDYTIPFEVRAVSNNLGVKRIFRSVRDPMSEISVLGYFPNPDGSRIAVIIAVSNVYYPPYATTYHVIGCHREFGFEKQNLSSQAVRLNLIQHSDSASIELGISLLSGPLNDYSINRFNLSGKEFAGLCVRSLQDSADVFFYTKTNGQWFEEPYHERVMIAGWLTELRMFESGLRRGFTVSKDLEYKHGFATLFLYDPATDRFEIVDGFDKLGQIFYLKEYPNVFYTYYSCGCADACWVSRLCSVQNGKVEIRMEIGCTCTEFYVTSYVGEMEKRLESSSCEDYQSDLKFEVIEAKWRTLAKTYSLRD
ncbi:MAG: hypothetical protein F9K32_18540 [Desulfobulbaceae bacterium]|nr:MAG: hypothetical protein F9K32_18540 [Desulfobulbaceae bacterium]